MKKYIEGTAGTFLLVMASLLVSMPIYAAQAEFAGDKQPKLAAGQTVEQLQNSLAQKQASIDQLNLLNGGQGSRRELSADGTIERGYDRYGNLAYYISHTGHGSADLRINFNYSTGADGTANLLNGYTVSFTNPRTGETMRSYAVTDVNALLTDTRSTIEGSFQILYNSDYSRVVVMLTNDFVIGQVSPYFTPNGRNMTTYIFDGRNGSLITKTEPMRTLGRAVINEDGSELFMVDDRSAWIRGMPGPSRIMIYDLKTGQRIFLQNVNGPAPYNRIETLGRSGFRAIGSGALSGSNFYTYTEIDFDRNGTVRREYGQGTCYWSDSTPGVERLFTETGVCYQKTCFNENGARMFTGYYDKRTGMLEMVDNFDVTTSKRTSTYFLNRTGGVFLIITYNPVTGRMTGIRIVRNPASIPVPWWLKIK